MHHSIWGGFSSNEVTYIHDYELVNMPAETFLEFKRLLSDLGSIEGVEVTYEPHKRRYCITTLVPVITTLQEES